MSRKALLGERILPLAILALAIIAVPVMIFAPSGLRRLEGLRQEQRRAEAEITRLSRDIEALRVKVDRIKADPASVERVARDELGLIRQTEVVFQFEQ